MKRTSYILIAGLVVLLLLGLGAVGAWNRHTRSPGYRLVHGTVEERQWAIRELAKHGATEFEYEHICRSLDDPDMGVRLVAVAAVARGRRPDAVTRLLPCAGKARPLPLRLRTLEALADLGGNGAWQQVREALASTEPELRALAARLLGRHNIPGALELLKPLLADAAVSVRTAAFEAVDALMPPPPAGVAGTSLANAERIVWEAERATGIKPNFDLAPTAYEKARLPELAATNPYWVNVAGHSGNGWLECLEGGGGNHEWLGGEGGSVDIGEAHYSLIVPRTGRYRLWARMWFTDKCGDSYHAWFDHGSKRVMDHPYHDVPLTEWRRWFWLADYLEPVMLEAGVHTLHIQVREDGIRIDQFCLLLDGAAGPADQAPLPVNYDPLVFAANGADLALYCGSLVIPGDGICRGAVQLRRLGTAPLTGMLEISIPGGTVAAGSERAETEAASLPLRLPVSLDGTRRVLATDITLYLPATVAASEHVLTARFLPADGGTPREVRRILTKPWPWQIAGPFGEPQNLANLLADRNVQWQEFTTTALYDRFGSMDFRQSFGKDAAGRVLLRCRFRCDTEAEYLWLLNSDDNSSIWLDGQPVADNPRNAPAEAFLTRVRMRISPGEHVLVAAVQQASLEEGDIYTSTLNQWKFRLRIRRDDHDPAPVTGLPWQDAPPAAGVPRDTFF